LGELYFENVAVARVLFAKLVVRVEQLAVSFGMARLELVVTTANSTWFTRQGYAPARADVKRSRGRIGDQSFCLGRALLRRQTRFARQIRAMGEQLGIPADYGRRHRLALQTEARQLSSIGPDVFGREQFLAPRCAAAWFQMQAAANEAGVELQAVSAFRSVKYQQEIVQRKLDQGAPIEDILNVSAAPGYSEHHSGRALDITAPGFLPLEEEFENSAAFTWLKQNANLFGFRLSFPRRNRHGLAYEPWHWCRCEGV
ncbi:MAG: M15 family metallopeptidase, partial [Lysobacterales bacterium]